jgi:hypothetical protein
VCLTVELELAAAAVYLAVHNVQEEPINRARSVSAAKGDDRARGPPCRTERFATPRRDGHDRGAGDGHYFKRLTAIQYEFGSTDHHVARDAQLTRQ